MERITTTERHAELREELAQAIRGSRGHSTVWPQDERTADAVLPFIEQAKAEVYEQARSDWPRMLTNAEVAAFNRGQAAGRVRVVEGLAATIKALPTTRNGADSAAKYPRTAWDYRRDVLAVVEAAREDTP